MKFYTPRSITAFSLVLLGFVFSEAPLLRADDGPAHRAAQTWPIELGTSGGNINDRSSLYCCSGTLGSLVQDANGVPYILSNNHVLGRANQAEAGEPVNHPGMIDQNCQINGILAEVSQVVPLQYRQGRNIPLNHVDAAMAEVVPGTVYPDGRILDIGGLSANTVSASLGQAVQKSGRTTGHTFGIVNAIDVTVEVGYSKECGGPANQKARFVNQISISDGNFSAGGDSGSLIVDASPGPDGLPRAVGLLFAGSDVSTIANPIDEVLSALNVSMVAGTLPPPPTTGQVDGTVTDAFSGSPIAGATITTDTGDSATSLANGTYLIPNVPVGNRTVSATATGYAPANQVVTVAENLTTTADFDLNVQVGPSQSIVECITYTTSRGKNADRNLLITVRVMDDFGNAVANATVGISVTQDGTPFGTGSAATDSNGDVVFNGRNAANGTYVSTVTAVSKAGLTFEGSTPVNAFEKGTDPVPSSFCLANPAGQAAPEEAIRAGVAFNRIRQIKARHSEALFNLPNVVGHGIGLGQGQPVIEVYLSADDAATRRQIPNALEGTPVRMIVTGPFTAD